MRNKYKLTDELPNLLLIRKSEILSIEGESDGRTGRCAAVHRIIIKTRTENYTFNFGHDEYNFAKEAIEELWRNMEKRGEYLQVVYSKHLNFEITSI